MSQNTLALTALVSEIKKNIQTFTSGISGHIADEVVLVVGSSKSGKTTFMNMLAHKPMKVLKEKGSWRADVVDEDYAGEIKAEDFLPMKIGHSADAETKFPNYVMAEDKQFWDCPGFSDTRGPEIEISNMYYVHHILKHATAPGKGGVKFIIIQDHDSINSSRGESFKKAINTICKIFPPQSAEAWTQLIDATTFVFTKVRPNDMSSIYLKDVLDRVTPDLPEGKHVAVEDIVYIEFLKKMKEMHSENAARIKHIEVPYACKGIDHKVLQEPVDLVTHQVLYSEHRALRDCAPKLIVAPRAIDVLKGYIQSCHVDFEMKCQEQLKAKLVETFKNMPDGFAANKIYEMSSILPDPTQQNVLNNGGATTLAEKLIKLLETFSSEGAYRHILSDIQTIIDLFKFCNDIGTGALLGADFTQIVEASFNAAKDYISADELRHQETFNAKWRAYINEQEDKYLAVKIAAFPVYVAVCFAIIPPAAMVGLVEAELIAGTGQAVFSGPLIEIAMKPVHYILKTVYGERSRPEPLEQDKFSGLKAIVDGALDITTTVSDKNPEQALGAEQAFGSEVPSLVTSSTLNGEATEFSE